MESIHYHNFFPSGHQQGVTALPIDPSVIKPENIGEERVVLEMECGAMIERIYEAFADAGFDVAIEFSPLEMFSEKVDVGHDPYYVLGVCNPNMTNRTLDVIDKKMGELFPCNVIVWKKEPSKQVIYHLSIAYVARLIGIVPDNDEMAGIIADTGELVEQALANLDAAGAQARY